MSKDFQIEFAQVRNFTVRHKGKVYRPGEIIVAPIPSELEQVIKQQPAYWIVTYKKKKPAEKMMRTPEEVNVTATVEPTQEEDNVTTTAKRMTRRSKGK